MSGTDWQLSVVHPHFTDQAWRDGASNLAKACERSAGECTADQLKMRISRGELALVAAVNEGKPKGWAALDFLQTPNMRILHVYAIYAPGAAFGEVFNVLKDYAKSQGCSAIQGACDEAVSRLWSRRFGFKETYRIMRYAL